MQELIAEVNDAQKEPISAEAWERIRLRVPPEHEAANSRAKEYAFRVYGWLHAGQLEPLH